MSRIAKAPVELPQGIEFSQQGNVVTIKGSKGSLTHELNSEVELSQEEGVLKLSPRSGSRFATAVTGTTRSLLANMVRGVSDQGCGYEHTLESWYRFLIDPDPYERVELGSNNRNQPVGTDNQLLQQRADFLRPDSLVAIVMLSDENDCSIRDGGQNYLAAQIFVPGSMERYRLPKPRAACATDPADPCCRSCAEDPGDGHRPELPPGHGGRRRHPPHHPQRRPVEVERQANVAGGVWLIDGHVSRT